MTAASRAPSSSWKSQVYPKPIALAPASVNTWTIARRRDSDCAARHVAAIFDPEQDAGDRSSSGSTNSPTQVYPKQVFMAGTTPHGDDEEPVYPLEVDMPDQTKLVITRDMAIQAMKHVDEGTF